MSTDYKTEEVFVSSEVQNSSFFAAGTYKKGQVLGRIKGWNGREVVKMTLDGVVATNGTATPTIRGVAMTAVNILNADLADAVATKIAAGTGPTGWTKVAFGNVVYFTADAVGVKSGANSFALGTSTGITASFEYVKIGVAAAVADTFTALIARKSDPVLETGAEVPAGIAVQDVVLAAPGYQAVAVSGELSRAGVVAINAALTVPVTIDAVRIAELNKAGFTLN